jgi:hypothetical protein
MECGVTVYTDSGKLQIDNNFKNLTLLRKVIVRCPALPTNGFEGYVAKGENPYRFYNDYKGGNQQWHASFEHIGEKEAGILEHTDDIKLLCVGLTDTPVAVIRHRGRYKIINVSKKEKDIVCYLFTDKMDNVGRAGFQVFDASGQVVFDANKKYMRVADYRLFDHSQDLLRLLELPLPKGRSYALCYTNFWYAHDSFVDGDDPLTSTVERYLTISCAFMFEGAVFVDPLKLYISTDLGGWNSNSEQYQSTIYSHLVIDVTGL